MGLFGGKDEEEKKKKIETEEVELEESSETEGYEDEAAAGVVISEEGLLTQINFIENVNVNQDHDMNLESFDFKGNLEIKNPSSKDRIWDLNINLENVEKTNIEESEIYVRELGVSDDENTDSREYELKEEGENKLLVKEFISTLPEAYENWDISELEKLMLEGEEGEEEEIGEEALEEEAEEEEIGEEALEEEAEEEELPIESFGITINKVNNVMFLIALRNQFENPIKDIEVIKELPSEFENIVILESTPGLAEREDNKIIWTIEELESDKTINLKLSADIQVETKDAVKTGPVNVSYTGSSSFAGDLSVENFSGYTRNRFTIDQIERDEEPGVWDCNLAFENPSEFLLELCEVDVHEADKPESNLIDIEAEAPIKLSAGDEWMSPGFEIESEAYPQIQKEIKFRVGHKLNTELTGEIAIGEVDLVLASITGNLRYVIPGEEKAEVEEEELEEEELEEEELEEEELEEEELEEAELEEEELEEAVEVEVEEEELEKVEEEERPIIKVPTFQESTVDSIIEIKNDGSAPLNEVSWKQRYFTDEFTPPSSEEITCFKDGEEISISPSQVTFEDNILLVQFKDLKDSDLGMFEADSELEFQYPIHVINPSQGATFESEVIINGNTYPKSKELEYIPEAEETPVIEAVHIRRKYRVGKEVVPVGAFGEYEIILSIINKGNMPLEKVLVRDKVPDNFERQDFSMEPEVIDLEGEDILKWVIDKVDVDSSVEITYKISGTGDYNPSQAQLSY